MPKLKKTDDAIHGEAAKNELEEQRRYIDKIRAERDQDLKAQREFAGKMKGARFGLVMEKAFAKSIRALGYKSTMYALAELLDNSIQAGAENIDILLHCEKGEAVTSIAVMDDGHGMDPEMIQIACLWGGTHREDDRTGFGRFGFGGPSSCASQGKRFTFYSAPEGGEVHSVTIDIDDISDGKLTGSDGLVRAPAAASLKERPFPKWLKDEMEKRDIDARHFAGTIVLIEKLDSLSYKSRTGLTNHLLEGFGVTYRNYLRQVNVSVGGTKIEPVDPLFITPGFRGYDTDDERATPQDPIVIPVKGEGGEVIGKIRVRFSLMSPTFAAIDKAKGVGTKNGNYRWTILKNYNKGICVLRKGRQIDTIDSECPWLVFRNYDRYWSCELDFDPSLDEELSVTTAKQQVRLSERMWNILEANGVRRIITQLRGEFDKLRAQNDSANDEKKEGKRLSEMAMEDASKFKRLRPGGTSPEHKQAAETALQREINDRAKAAQLPPETVAEVVRKEKEAARYKVQPEDMPGAPFFRAMQVGPQVVVYLNKAHSFYTNVYAGPGATPHSRAGLEVLLFAIADCMLDASDEQRQFYANELPAWSQRLANAVDALADLKDPGEQDLPLDEAASA